MNKTKKLCVGLMAMLLGAGTLINSAYQVAKADTVSETATITLHKRVYETGQMPSETVNTGNIMPDFGGKGLNGVTFTVYDVTEKYLELRKGGQDSQDAISTIQSDSTNKAPSYANELDKKVTATVGNEDGIATFSDIAMKQDDKYRALLFVETDSPTNVTQKAQPIVITFPIYQPDSEQINTDIHLYPKNTQDTEDFDKKLTDDTKKDLEVIVGGNTLYVGGIGDLVEYEISATLPWNIADKKKFTISDNPQEGLDVKLDTLQIDGLTKGTDYTVEKVNNGFTITLNTTADNVVKKAGTKLKVTYQMEITSLAKADTSIQNKATLVIDDNSKTDTADEIYVGGANFLKIDKDDKNKTLKGAKFYLTQIDSSKKVVKYAVIGADGKITWQENSEGATLLESDAAGRFSVNGLRYSSQLESGNNYALVEHTAPANYIKLEGPIEFTVTKNSSKEENVIKIENQKKGSLPSTGSKKVALLALVGIFMTLIGILGVKLSNKNEDK